MAREVRQGAAPGRKVEIVLAPPYTALAAVAGELTGSDIRLAAQDTFWKAEGAFTGAISPLMLKDAGCHYVIIGHSERRQHFGETNHTVNLKVKAALAANLKVILCLGETRDERQAEKTMAVVRQQLREGLLEVTGAAPDFLVIAYEPVWAIGTGDTATPDQAQEVHQSIRRELPGILGLKEDLRILYGGSMTPENAAALLQEPDIDGGLLGGASLKAASFLQIIGIAAARRP